MQSAVETLPPPVESAPAALPALQEQIAELGALLRQMPQVNPQTTHMLCGGVYARSVFMPAGTAVVGCIHKSNHIIVQVCGDTTITTPDGPVRLTGWHMFPVKAGAARALYIHEDTIWTSFHHTTKTTVEEIENDLIANPEGFRESDVGYAAPLLHFDGDNT
jgi:hypothetical protein